MPKIKFYISLIFLLTFVPVTASALSMPQNGSDLAGMAGISAEAYIVMDAKTGEVLAAKNETLPRVPASLTKLLTALVVLDSKVKLTKTVAIKTDDQIAGSCSKGGACIKAKSGVKFTVDGLLHALLMPSANNAAYALARSTGLAPADFAGKMNKKAADLGAVGTHFNEPTGLDPNNVTTAQDYAKIVAAAFQNAYLRKIAGLQKFTLRSTNNSRYNQVIKNTDKLLADKDIKILGAKTGYLEESQYNFAALAQYRGGDKLAIVVLGEDRLASAFAETKLLASLAEEAKALALMNLPKSVLGTSTTANDKN